MTVDEWVFEALEQHPKAGATVREVQRYIDEHHYEELAVDTIEAALENLVEQGRATKQGTRWLASHKVSKDDALKKLFGE
jgi:protoheme ferro-lyase